jgi:putative two-component system response regulator
MPGKKILVVDDAPSNIKILNDMLKNDYTIAAANNGADALKIAASDSPPDIILLDVMMPEMDGFEVCKKLKADEKTKKIPVIFVTSKDEIDNKLDGYELGAVHYITKPLDPDYVIESVKKFI